MSILDGVYWEKAYAQDEIDKAKAEMKYNRDCYWSFEDYTIENGKYFPQISCCFNKTNGLIPCEGDKPCKYYCHRDKIDDYIHHLLDEIEILTKLPQGENL